MAHDPSSRLQDDLTADHFGDTLETAAKPGAQGLGNLIQVATGPSKGASRPFATRVLIGRSKKCDLIIDDPTVSREHLRVERSEIGYVAVNLNAKNFTLLNGKEISSATVRDGDILQLGDTTLKLTLREDSFAPARSQRSKRRLLLAVGLCLVLGLGFVALRLLSSPPAQREQAVIEEETRKQQDMERSSQNQALADQLTAANRFLGQGNIPAASDRFRAALKLDPANAEARSGLARCEKTLAEESNARLADQQRAMELKQQVAPLLTEANVRLSVKDYAGAKQHLLQAKAIAPEEGEIAALLARVETGLAEEQAKKQQIEIERRTRHEQAKKHLRTAQEHKQASKHFPAIQAYDQFLAMAPEAPEAGQAKQDAQELRAKLVEQTAPAMKKAEDFTKKGKTLEALAIWREVLLVYPEHPEASRRVAALVPQLEEKASTAYQEGLAYEDLGQTKKAIAKWQEVITLLNNPEHETVIKAQKKLKELQVF